MPRDIESLREAIGAEVAAREPEATPETDEPTVPETGDDELPAVEEQVPEQVDDGDIEYINDLPRALGWESEEFYKLKMKLADDQDPIAFGEIKDRLQGVEEERRKLQQQHEDLERKAAAFQQQAMAAGQAQQAVTKEMADADMQVKAIEGAMGDLEADWTARQGENPGQVALERQLVADRLAKAKSGYREAAGKAAQQQQQARGQWLAQQHAEVAKRLPDWQDPVKRRDLAKSLTDFATEHYGVSPQEMRGIDARTLVMLNDAMEGRRAREGADKAVEKIRKAPKITAGKLRRRGQMLSDSRVAELTTRATNTGKTQDKLAAARAIIDRGKR